MTRMLLGAMSGWGKSWHAQAIMEENAEGGEHEGLVVLDFKDEYRGLVKAGLCKHYIVGECEKDTPPERWKRALERNPYLVLARVEDMSPEEWRNAVAKIVAGARRLDRDVLVAIDEAHFVAPNQGKIPQAVKGLATTGRGEGASSMWITQRLTELKTTIVSQVDAYVLGAFRDRNDRNRINGSVEYDVRAHVPGGKAVAGLPEDLHAPDEGAISVRKWTERATPTGSEWLYSDESGEMKRIDTRDVSMHSTHYGPPGNTISLPA